VNFLAALGTGTSRRDRLASAFSRLHGEGRALLTRLWDGLSAVAGVRLYGPPPTAPRTPTVSFTVADRNPAEVTAKLVERGVFVSHGDFYASTVVERMGQGTHGMVRAGCACYTTADEVDRLVEGVAALARRQST
jgi:selenocysteine lyase/cysteine desulfurase